MFRIIRNGLKENKGLTKRLMESLDVEDKGISAEEFEPIIDKIRRVQERLKEVNIFEEGQLLDMFAQLILIEYAVGTMETAIESSKKYDAIRGKAGTANNTLELPDVED